MRAISILFILFVSIGCEADRSITVQEAHENLGNADILFLDVLVDSRGKGSNVFSDLFRNNDPLLLFKFLGEKTNIFEEIRIFISVNIMTFVRSLLKRISNFSV